MKILDQHDRPDVRWWGVTVVQVAALLAAAGGFELAYEWGGAPVAAAILETRS